MALLLRDVVGLSYTEIADSLEVTLATVKWRIYKAREDVQLALAREGITLRRRAGRADAARRRRPPGGLAPRSLAELQPRPRASPAAPPRESPPAFAAMSYATRRKLARRASRSRTRYAARGSPSRGWPTEPGLRIQRAPARSTSSRRERGRRELVASQCDLERDVAVADEHERLLGQPEGRERGLVGEHVLPDRVARAAVEEVDAVRAAEGLQRLEVRARARRQHSPSSAPQRRRRRRSRRGRLSRARRGRGSRRGTAARAPARARSGASPGTTISPCGNDRPGRLRRRRRHCGAVDERGAERRLARLPRVARASGAADASPSSTAAPAIRSGSTC